MYHPGKILEVIRPNNHNSETHAVIEMWDKHIFTFDVSSKISNIIKNGDIALVDYSPSPTPPPHPKRVICKILEQEEGIKVMGHYQAHYEKNVKKSRSQTPNIPEPTNIGIA